MVEGIIHKKLKKEIEEKYKRYFNVCFEFCIFNRNADVVLFKNHKLYAIIECKNKQFKKELFQKFDYWRKKGINCKFIVYSVKTSKPMIAKKCFREMGIEYIESKLKKDDWKNDFKIFPKEKGVVSDGS